MKTKNKLFGYFLLLTFLLTPISTSAKIVWKIPSVNMHRQVPVEIYTPTDYKLSQPIPLVYLLHGYSENYTQWGKITDCQQLADTYHMLIVCPEGFTSFYLNSNVDSTSQYEKFFFEELKNKIHQSYCIDMNNIFISGLSMGGYGALRLFILHPEYFNTAGCTSGAVDMDYTLFHPISLKFWGNARMTDDLKKVLGPPDHWRQSSITTLLSQLTNFKREFIFDCGTEDPLYNSAINLKKYLAEHEIPATFFSGPGTHDWDYWKKSIVHHFVFFSQHLKDRKG